MRYWGVRGWNACKTSGIRSGKSVCLEACPQFGGLSLSRVVPLYHTTHCKLTLILAEDRGSSTQKTEAKSVVSASEDVVLCSSAVHIIEHTGATSEERGRQTDFYQVFWLFTTDVCNGVLTHTVYLWLHVCCLHTILIIRASFMHINKCLQVLLSEAVCCCLQTL